MANNKNIRTITCKSVKSLKLGDAVIVKRQPCTGDDTAVGLYDTDMNFLCFLTASEKSRAGRTKYPLAKDYFNRLPNSNVVGAVVGFDEKNAIVEFAVGDEVVKNVITLYGELGGSKVIFPDRQNVIVLVMSDKDKTMRDKMSAQVKGDDIIVSYNGKDIGNIRPTPKTNLMPIYKAENFEVVGISDIMKAIDGAEEIGVELVLVKNVTPIVKFVIQQSEEAVSTSSPTPTFDVNAYLSGVEEADKAEIETRVGWLKANKVKEYAIKLFLERVKNQKGLPKFNPKYIPNGGEIEFGIAFSAGINGHRGNLMLVGPAGSGKNVYLATLANLFGYPLIDNTCSVGVDEETLFGHLSMKATEELPSNEAVNVAFKRFMSSMAFIRMPDKESFNSMSPEEQIQKIQELAAEDEDTFDYSPIFSAIRGQASQIAFEPSILTKSLEGPAIVNLDEVNTLRPTVTSSMHSALDHRRTLLINAYKGINIHPDVVFTSTMNEGTEYAGTNLLNQAFEDRWHVIEFDAPDKIGPILKQEVPSLTKQAVASLEKLYDHLKCRIKNDQMESDRTLSQRAFIYCAINIAQGNGIKDAIAATIMPKIRDVNDRQAAESLVDLVLK